jgi:hypothetical protein
LLHFIKFKFLLFLVYLQQKKIKTRNKIFCIINKKKENFVTFNQKYIFRNRKYKSFAKFSSINNVVESLAKYILSTLKKDLFFIFELFRKKITICHSAVYSKFFCDYLVYILEMR